MLAKLLIGSLLAAVPPLAAAGETITYSYDAKGRLTAVSRTGGPGGGVTSSYAFDHPDNRTGTTVTGAAAANAGRPAGSAPDVTLAALSTSARR